LPLYRGKGRNKSFKSKPLVVNLKVLNLLPAKSEVTKELLIKYRILSPETKDYRVKILGEGELKHSLIIKLPISKSAARKVEKAGGKVTLSSYNLKNKRGQSHPELVSGSKKGGDAETSSA
jgi:large subunit ribosomal protein L15